MFSDKQYLSSKTGSEGESLAREYLEHEGYKFVEQNFRRTFGEIDLIMIDKNGILCFVEVKTARGKALQARDYLRASKIDKLLKICSYYANRFKDVSPSGEWRMDALFINYDKEKNTSEIEHVKNILADRPY